MLISFSVENWQSFRKKATLSMVASLEKEHSERLAKIKKHPALLPAAAIYGANASGKTKFFNALVFAKKFILKVTQPESNISREYFKLDSKCAKKPSKFNFELLIENSCYEFSFSVTEKKVVEEQLIKISSTNTEEILYTRKKDKINFFNEQLSTDQRLQFVAEGTRANQLFLTNTINQKITHFQTIYDWFNDVLTLIKPESRFSGLGEFFKNSNRSSLLEKLDTGIANVKMKDIPPENLKIPEKLKSLLMEKPFLTLEGDGNIFLEVENGAISAKRLVTYHKSIEGKDILFSLDDESQGTQRMMHLLPCLWQLSQKKNPKVYFIDELDRCLHTLLTRYFLENYLQNCRADTRSQLIFTTHDVLLMDKHLFRHDEIWITEKDQDGCSSLTSFSEFKDIDTRNNLAKDYLQGRLGGIPNLLL